MSVLDASTLTDALVRVGTTGDACRERVAAEATWHAPALLPAEVTSALRGLVLGGHLRQRGATRARHRLGRMQVRLHGFEPHADRVWELRENLTTYDAWYVALAEALGEPLVTTDARLATAPGTRCEVELLR